MNTTKKTDKNVWKIFFATGIILMVMSWLFAVFLIKDFTSGVYWGMTLGLFFIVMGVIVKKKQ